MTRLKPGSKGRPLPLAVRRERLLDQIALNRSVMREAAMQWMQPLSRVDRFQQYVRDERHWIYPAAPVLALLAWRWKGGLNKVPTIASRGFLLWRLWRRIRLL
jgi:hypothetical protein